MNSRTIPENELQHYRMPAEWTAHSGTLLSWPANLETWPDDERLERVETVFINILKVLTRFETAHVIISNDSARKRAEKAIEKHLSAGAPVKLHQIPGNDMWARDFGPIFIRHQKTNEFAITDWDYNAWGEKYPPFQSDDKIPSWFAEKYNLPVIKPGMVLEGGSIDTNGNGVMLTTESVLLNSNRNPDMTKEQIEQNLKRYLGQEKVIWLKNGLAGDDTDGHIDDLSRFINPSTIVTMIIDDRSDVNYETLQENYDLLKSATDQFGKPFNIVKLPMPHTRIEGTTVDGSEYVPASYANFYFVNGAVLLPVYDPKFDDQVVSTFKKLLPNHEIIPISCADLVWGQGSIHCITQQVYGL